MSKEKFINIIRLTIVYGIFLALILPLLFLAIWSITQDWPWPHLLPQSFSLEVWRDFFSFESRTSIRAWDGLKESFLIGIRVVFLSLAVSVPAAKALALYQFKGKELIKLLVLAPIIVPPLAVTMGIHINFMRYGLSGTRWGVVLVHLIPTIPYTVKILTHTFEGSGKKFEEQAQVLGANLWQRFFYITLPLIKPGIFAGAIMAFIISFSQYILTFLMGEGRVVTYPMVLFPLVEQGNRILASVYSWVFILGVLFFIFILEKTLNNDRVENKYFYM